MSKRIFMRDMRVSDSEINIPFDIKLVVMDQKTIHLKLQFLS